MNLMLITDTDIQDDHSIKLSASDRRAIHLRQVLRLQPGDQIKVGLVDGLLGRATLQTMDQQALSFSMQLDTPPPAPLDITLILGLPRPKMMRRIVQCTVSMGVKDIIFINTSKVEKSYWQTPWLKQDSLRDQCLLGLEQAMDTRLPAIRHFKLFKPFAEDHLPAITANRQSWFAHPGESLGVPPAPAEMVLAIGPEGGFTPYETEKLAAAGMQGFHIGRRILRMETAIPAILGRFYL